MRASRVYLTLAPVATSCSGDLVGKIRTCTWVSGWKCGTGRCGLAVQVLADVWGQLYFLDVDGERVSIELGMPARLVDECLVTRDIESEECSGVEVPGVWGSEVSSLAFSNLFRLWVLPGTAQVNGWGVVVDCWGGSYARWGRGPAANVVLTRNGKGAGLDPN